MPGKKSMIGKNKSLRSTQTLWFLANCYSATVIIFFELFCAPTSPVSAEPANDQKSASLGCKEHPLVGERLAFQGRWLGIPVGSGTLEVKEIVEIEGRKAYHIHGEGRTNDVLATFYPIEDTVESYLDVETLKPVRFEKRQREGRYRSDEVVIFDHDKRLAYYESRLNGSKKEIPIENGVQDLISTLYWLRRQKIEPETTQTVDIYTDEKIFRTEIRIGRLQELEILDRGTFQALVIEPKATFKGMLVKRGRIWAYMTGDPGHLPLLIKATTPWGPMNAVLDQNSLKNAQALWRDTGGCATGS